MIEYHISSGPGVFIYVYLTRQKGYTINLIYIHEPSMIMNLIATTILLRYFVSRYALADDENISLTVCTNNTVNPILTWLDINEKNMSINDIKWCNNHS